MVAVQTVGVPVEEGQDVCVYSSATWYVVKVQEHVDPFPRDHVTSSYFIHSDSLYNTVCEVED